MSSTKSFRSRQQSVAMIAVGIVGAALVLASALGAGVSTPARIGGLLVATALLLVSARLAMAGVYVHGEKVRIRNPLHTTTVDAE